MGAELASDDSRASAATRGTLLADLLAHYTRVVTKPKAEFKDVAVAVRVIGALARPTARLQGPTVSFISVTVSL